MCARIPKVFGSLVSSFLVHILLLILLTNYGACKKSAGIFSQRSAADPWSGIANASGLAFKCLLEAFGLCKREVDECVSIAWEQQKV